MSLDFLYSLIPCENKLTHNLYDIIFYSLINIKDKQFDTF